MYEEFVRGQAIEIVWRQGFRREILLVVADHCMSTAPDCGRKDVAIFGLICHRTLKALVPNDFSVFKRVPHRDQASFRLRFRVSEPSQRGTHFSQDIGGPPWNKECRLLSQSQQKIAQG